MAKRLAEHPTNAVMQIRVPTLGAAFLACLVPAEGIAHGTRDSANERITRRLEAERTELVEFRRDLHRHPDLSGQEERTAGAVAAQLRDLGLDVRTGVGGHGVVAVLRGRQPGRTLGFRADMDAVRSSAADPVAFRSKRSGIRHICGHDIHTTVGIALAHALHEVRGVWSGTVVFYFQPEEENARGARRMIEAGCLDQPKPEAFFAYHCAPNEVGTIGATPGHALPQRDAVRITLSGSGDLESAAKAIREMILALNTLEDPSGAPSQTEPFIVATVAAGTRASSGQAQSLRAQVTASDPETSNEAHAAIEDWLRKAEFVSVKAELQYDARFVPGIYNDPVILKSTENAIRSTLGEESYALTYGSPPQFSEDFGAFQEQAPGVMYWLGVSNAARGTRGAPHSPDFVADEEAIFVGARAMAAILMSQLE